MKKKSITGVLVLLVFAAFLVSVSMVLMTGADVVQNITTRDQKSYSQRTVTQYLTTRVRRADQAGAVITSDTGTLIFREEISGICYETSVYFHEGYLREMFYESGYPLSPEFGEKILPIQDFQSFRDGSLVHITFKMPDGTAESLILHLRSEREELP